MRFILILSLLALGILPMAGQVRRRTPSSPLPANQPAATFKGTIKSVEGGKLQLELPDGNLMEFFTTRKSRIQLADPDGKGNDTKLKDVKLKDLVPGQTAEIEGRRVLRELELVSAVVTMSKKPSPEP
jgi:hypothetical protein